MLTDLLPPAPHPRRDTSALVQHLAGTLWAHPAWKGNRRGCERAAQAVVNHLTSLAPTDPAVRELMDAEVLRLREELAEATATIQHMGRAMSYVCGHDRSGTDHLAETMYEAGAREAAVKQARSWATRARNTEEHLGRVRQVLLEDGHFQESEIGPDLAPRVAELLIRYRNRLAAAEEHHPAVTAWGQCFDRAQAAEDCLAAVHDLITDMEATTGARHWARLLRQAAGKPGEDYGGPQAWRRRAIRRALAISRLTSTITAVCDLAHDTPPPDGSDRTAGYAQALADLRTVLTELGHLPDDTSADGADLVHSCTNPQARTLVEVDDKPIPVVHRAHRDREGHQ